MAATAVATVGAPSAPAFAVVGAGALGQAWAALLAASGQPVTVLASGATSARLLEAGAIRLAGAVELTVPVARPPAPPGAVGLASTPAELPRGAGLVFATKGHQLPQAIESIRRVIPVGGPADRGAGGGMWVAGVQNGLAKDDLLRDAFGATRVVGAATIFSAQREADGRVRVTGLGTTYLGEFGGASSPRVSGAADALRQAGLPVETTSEIERVLWSKACHAVGVFGVSALTRRSGASLWASADLVRAYRSLIQEAAAVAGAHGVAVGDFAGFPIRTYLQMSEAEHISRAASGSAPRARPAAGAASAPPALPSMTQDVLAGRALEVDEVFGDIADRARRFGVPTPRVSLVRDLLRGLDPRYGCA